MSPTNTQIGLKSSGYPRAVSPFSTFSEAFERTRQAFRRDTETVGRCIERAIDGFGCRVGRAR